ncbi:MAG: hypothetical protein DCE90_03550 [Pseudanabaena sp.]|nr:MAG: hypothetical protein DCE90_03550 [Pseudanabaena sp.]
MLTIGTEHELSQTCLILSHYTALCAGLKPRNNFESVASQRFQNYFWQGFWESALRLIKPLLDFQSAAPPHFENPEGVLRSRNGCAIS